MGSTRTRQLLGANVYWLGSSLVGDGLAALVLPVVVLHASSESAQATTLGIVIFLGTMAGLLTQPIAGLVSDNLRPRWGRGGTLAVGTLLTVAALALFGAATEAIAIVVAYALVQIAVSVAQASQQAYIADLFPSVRRGLASGIKGFLDVGGAFLAFLLLGPILASGGVTPALTVIAAVLALVLGLTLVLVRERRDVAAPPIHLLHAFHFDLRSHRSFAWVVLSRFLFLLGVFVVGRFLLLFIADRLALDPGSAAKQAGLLLAALTMLTAVTALPAGWLTDRIGRMPLLVAGSLASAGGALLLSVAAGTTEIAVAGGLMAVGSAAFAAANWALTADLAPNDEAGRFLGLANIGTAGAAAAAGLVGPVIDWSRGAAIGGYSLAFVIAAVAFLLSAVALRPTVLAPWTPRAVAVGRPG